MDRWRRDNCDPKDSTLYVGFDWTEIARLDAIRNILTEWRIEAPLTTPPFWDKCDMIREARALGLPISSAYTLGLPHDNCGGGCVRAGFAHWAKLLKIRPSTFAQWETQELAALATLRQRGLRPLTILRDRRGGMVSNLTLANLRSRIEAGELFPTDDWGGCGCNGLL